MNNYYSCVGHKGAGTETAEGGLEPGLVWRCPVDRGPQRAQEVGTPAGSGKRRRRQEGGRALQCDEAAGRLVGEDDMFIEY